MDFCTTSVLRPNILEECYSSFQKNIINLDLKNCRLFLNIDPIGIPINNKLGELPKPPFINSPEENIEVAKKYFGDVVYRIPDEPSFPKAVKWLWGQVETDFVFLLEDDWNAIGPIDVNLLLNIFIKKPSLNQIRLHWKIPSHETAVPCHGKYGLSPSIVRKRFCHHFAKYMKEDRNPERFIVNNALSKVDKESKKLIGISKKAKKNKRKLYLIMKKRVIYFYNNPVVSDNGDEWSRKLNITITKNRVYRLSKFITNNSEQK